MNTAQIIPFQFEAQEVRAFSDDTGEPWFCAADLCSVLGYRNAPDAIGKHCREAGIAKRDISSGGQKRSVTFINEGNLYRLIIKSRKEEAQRFESWVCDEVLPAIRKHGRYDDNDSKMSTLIGQTIGTDGFHCLGAVLDGKVRQLPVKARQRAKMHVWSQVHKAFSVVSAQDIPASQLDSARNFIAAYALEGEWLGKDEPKDGVYMAGADLYLVYFLCRHFNSLNKIFKQYNMYNHLSGLGSPAGSAMVDHFTDGSHASFVLMKKYAQSMDDYQRDRRMNAYASR
ncbi:Bro-N domain-containing protein [Pseudomonas sp.]|uniref:BRO-N domain-containing protein n=1 Tax=Pseudomonas sp. TaxID=306 RepID=UPI00257A86C3|nr:Bro-N domain-containing protein [Pseudomonas sp.]